MKKKTLLKLIEDLEERVAELEARPQPNYLQPYYPWWGTTPPHWYYTPTITTTGSETFTIANASPITITDGFSQVIQ